VGIASITHQPFFPQKRFSHTLFQAYVGFPHVQATVHTAKHTESFDYRGCGMYAGTDAFEMFTRKIPEPLVLLQQAALGCAGIAADQSKRPDFATPNVLADLLEEVFQCIADEKSISKFTQVQAVYGMPIKKLQFAVMRMLCVIYREVCTDRCSRKLYETLHTRSVFMNDCNVSEYSHHLAFCFPKVFENLNCFSVPDS
jgi:hypothetical protein